MKFQAVSLTFEAARLSRELERPRFETDGRFARATTIARKHGSSVQLLRAVYEHIWTSFWWFDDLDPLLERYEEVEAIAFPTGLAAHISKVCNLHQLLVGQVANHLETIERLSFPERSTRLKEILTSLASESSRPNNALYAETLLSFHRLSEMLVARQQNSFDEIWTDLSGIIDRAEGLGEFPADLIDQMVEGIGELAPDSQAFDRLVEKLAEFMAARDKEISAGNIYLMHGERKLDAEKPVDAIKWLGRAVLNFTKDESREEQAKSLYFLAIAYRGAGLLWAARSISLASIVQYLALSDLRAELKVETIPALNLFAMLSLQMGHVLDVLSALYFVQAIENVAPLDEDSKERLNKKVVEFDGLLACLIIAQPAHEIARLEYLPDVLDNLKLFTAELALLYRLGYQDTLLAKGFFKEGSSREELFEFLKLLAIQPAAASLPRRLVINDKDYCGVETKVLGVSIHIVTPSSNEGFLQAETYAAALEGFAATLLNMEAFPHKEKFLVNISQSSEAQIDIISEKGGACLEVVTPIEWQLTDVKHLAPYNEHLVMFSALTLGSIAFLPNAGNTIEELVKNERAFERATLFCHAGISRNRVFGAHTGQIENWDHWTGTRYSLAVDAPGVPTGAQPISEKTENEDSAPRVFGELQNHRDMDIRSIINTHLWDAAKWQGILYGRIEKGQPPILGLLFTDAKSGDAIFNEWILQFGREDVDDKIRISVLKGIDSKNPFHYRGHITRQLDTEYSTGSNTIFNISRMTTMTVDNHQNLEMFIEYFNACGAFYLVPAYYGSSGQPELRRELAILKRKFFARHAWEVSVHDTDMMAVKEDDQVIVPAGVVDPPFKSILDWRKKTSSQRRADIRQQFRE
jgi:hypothetical protein